MQYLSLKDIQQVSGGDLSASVTFNVPDDYRYVFLNLLGSMLTGNLNASTFANAVASEPWAYDQMAITAIGVGNFTITPNH